MSALRRSGTDERSFLELCGDPLMLFVSATVISDTLLLPDPGPWRLTFTALSVVVVLLSVRGIWRWGADDMSGAKAALLAVGCAITLAFGLLESHWILLATSGLFGILLARLAHTWASTRREPSGQAGPSSGFVIDS